MVNAAVGGAAIAAMSFTLMISLFLPVIGLIIYALKNKKQGIVSAWFLGAAGFFITQMVIRTPVLSMLSMSEGFMSFATNHYLLYALLLAFSAGLFEVAGRYAAAKILSKNLTFKRGAAAGLGHGGIEAMLLIGVSYISNILYAGLINSGAINMVIEQTEAMGVDASPIQALADTLVNTPAYLFGLAGYERLLTMLGQTAMSLIVFYFVWKKQDAKGIGICLFIHTLLDGVCVIVSGMATPYLGSLISTEVSYAMVYIYLTAAAVFFAVVIHKIKLAWKE